MIKLNDNSIFVGQIKQLLHSFNLPNCKFSKEADDIYPNSHILIDGSIFYIDSDYVEHYVGRYIYGKEYLNLTSNLKIENMLYDRYTHRYLGNYLRFLRDYHKIDLMSMYNCFDEEAIDHNIALSDDIIFKENDPSYITYQIPISYKSNLTIKIASNITYETCLYFAPQVLSKDMSKIPEEEDARKYISSCTYKKYRGNVIDYINPTQLAVDSINDIINKTIVKNNYILQQDDKEKLIENYIEILKKYQKQLYVLLRIPKSFNKAIVVLEGTFYDKNFKQSRYLRYRPINQELTSNSSVVSDMIKYYSVSYYNQLLGKTDPDAIIRFDQNGSESYYYNCLVDSGFKIIAQLLAPENNTQSYLLGDKLIEYLTQNAITNTSISNDIKRLQLALDSMRDDFTSNLIYSVKDEKQYPSFNVREDQLEPDPNNMFIVQKEENNVLNSTPKNRKYGIWNYLDHQDMKAITYLKNLNLEYDCLGYLDKELEMVLRRGIDNAEV